MELAEYGSSWIWHPDWVDIKPNSAGGFIHFRKNVHVSEIPTDPVLVNITADTRYKLYINSRLVHYGPVKGDENRWFYDTVDIQPFLRHGENQVAVHVLRYFHSTTYASSFARMPIGGLYLRTLEPTNEIDIDSDASWDTAIDPAGEMRADEAFDLFLHIYERVDRRKDVELSWTKAKVIVFEEGWGITLPWKLCPRFIPRQIREPVRFKQVNNIRSAIEVEAWQRIFEPITALSREGVRLPPGTSHHVEFEVENHLTALLAFRFAAASSAGSTLRVTYGECYEDEPFIIPHCRRKTDRCDRTKKIIGPSDIYTFGGQNSAFHGYHVEATEEVYQPFHFRTFRVIALDIDVARDGSGLIFNGIDITKTNYPLERKANFDTGDEWVSKFWDISVRTLENCMHDNYEDCPFYEQLSFPMDARSAALFTYIVAGDDRLARQAITQFHDSFNPSVGLTLTRVPCNSMQRQIIAPFSLYWVCMVSDHYEYFGDADFSRQFIGVCDSVLETFSRRVDPALGLVRAYNGVLWEYTDWTRFWVPNGVPPALKRTGFSTYINFLYIYTLRRAAWHLRHLGRVEIAGEYDSRADAVTVAVQTYCYDGEFFTDGLATKDVPRGDYSQHCQVWAVLSGAATGDDAVRILDQSLSRGDVLSQALYEVERPAEEIEGGSLPVKFTMTSISFAFYTIRALAAAGGDVYDRHFEAFWAPWREQVANHLTTWAEDAVSVRSDCHVWGSVPIYEFVAEVAGIKPASPGWASISVKPHLKLLPRLSARVPVRGPGGTAAMLQVRWSRKESDQSVVVVELDLSAESGQVVVIPTIVYLPGREVETIDLSGTAIYEVVV